MGDLAGVCFKEKPEPMRAASMFEDRWEEWREGDKDAHDNMDEDNFPNFDPYKVNKVEQPNELDEVMEVRSNELEESSEDAEVYDYLHRWSRGNLPYVCRWIREGANEYKRLKADLGWQ